MFDKFMIILFYLFYIFMLVISFLEKEWEIFIYLVVPFIILIIVEIIIYRNDINFKDIITKGKIDI